MEITINTFQLATTLAIASVLTFYNILAKPAIKVAQLTYENGYSIKNFSPLL